jgi:hypothetical protein
MGFFDKLIRYKWSINFFHNGELYYEMQNDSIMRMLGYVMNSFVEHGNPNPPWSIYINYNRDNTSFTLTSKYFNGDSVAPSLIDKIKSIDSNWRVTGSEPKFWDIKNNKRLKISSSGSIQDTINMSTEERVLYLEKQLEGLNRPREKDFFDVLHEIFENK